MTTERAFMARNYPMSRAPKRITLLGDRAKPEPATHIIEFPGGAVELSRIADDEYWAHVIINRGWAHEMMEDTRQGARGQVVDSRVFVEQVGLREIVSDPAERVEVSQIVVLIRTSR